jgi:Trypsin-co-occurring domain 1
MAQLTRFEVDGQPVLIETRTPGEPVLATGVGELVVKATDKSLASVFGLVRRIAGAYGEAMDGVPVTASEVEFGLDLTAGGDLYVVNGEAASSLKVKLSFG